MGPAVLALSSHSDLKEKWERRHHRHGQLSLCKAWLDTYFSQVRSLQRNAALKFHIDGAMLFCHFYCEIVCKFLKAKFEKVLSIWVFQAHQMDLFVSCLLPFFNAVHSSCFLLPSQPRGWFVTWWSDQPSRFDRSLIETVWDWRVEISWFPMMKGLHPLLVLVIITDRLKMRHHRKTSYHSFREYFRKGLHQQSESVWICVLMKSSLGRLVINLTGSTVWRGVMWFAVLCRCHDAETDDWQPKGDSGICSSQKVEAGPTLNNGVGCPIKHELARLHFNCNVGSGVRAALMWIRRCEVKGGQGAICKPCRRRGSYSPLSTRPIPSLRSSWGQFAPGWAELLS